MLLVTVLWTCSNWSVYSLNCTLDIDVMLLKHEINVEEGLMLTTEKVVNFPHW